MSIKCEEGEEGVSSLLKKGEEKLDLVLNTDGTGYLIPSSLRYREGSHQVFFLL